MITMFLPSPENLHDNYIKQNKNFPRLCAVPISVLSSLIELDRIVFFL